MKNRTDYSIAKKRKAPHRFHAVNFIRAAVQLVSFIVVPALFISIFSSIGEIYRAIISGTFDFSAYAWRMVLVAAIFAVTIIWGRFFCGFICSFGAMQDLLWLGGKHLPKKIKIPEKADKVLRLLKWAVLLFIVAGVWTFSAEGTTLWSPWTIFGMYATFKGFPSGTYLLSVGGLLMLVIIIGSVFIERFFCKYLCPLGALFSVASRFRIFRIKKPSAQCGHCKLCTGQCTMAIPMNRYDTITSGECINCLRCTTVCHRQNVKADVLPAVSGTAAAAALMGVYYVGCIPAPAQNNSGEILSAEVSLTNNSGPYKDGTYTGTGTGFRGTVAVTVTVSGGYITDISVDEKRDDSEFFAKVQNAVIPAILAAQSTEVDTVSGATFSSNGLIEAVKNALGDQILFENSTEQTQTSADENSKTDTSNTHNRPHSSDTTNSDESSSDESSLEESSLDETSSDESSLDESSSEPSGLLADGVYTGTGTGYRGATSVTVTVVGGRITDITVNSYQDDNQFFSRAASGVISAILAAQSTEVDTVSGATFSSNGLIEAVSQALGIDFTNPNSTAGRKHGR